MYILSTCSYTRCYFGVFAFTIASIVGVCNSFSALHLVGSFRQTSVLTSRYPTARFVGGVAAESNVATSNDGNDDDEDDGDDDSTTKATFVVPPFVPLEFGGYPSPLHKVYVEEVLSREEAAKCLELAQKFGVENDRWDSVDSERHQAYATCDFPIEDCSELEEYMNEINFDGRIFGRLSELYGIELEDMSYIDLFCAHYQAKETEESPGIDRLEAHRDGSLLSFSLLLNPPEEFEGGGTFYTALRDVPPSGLLKPNGVIRPKQAGHSVFHCGKILHGADIVTSGSRTVIVGFVDVASHCHRPGVIGEACKNWGRMDVAEFRLKRQKAMGDKGWSIKNGRLITGTAHLKNFVPSFDSVVRRGDPEFRNQNKLQTEDILLRQILLPEDERIKPVDDMDDYTIIEK